MPLCLMLCGCGRAVVHVDDRPARLPDPGHAEPVIRQIPASVVTTPPRGEEAGRYHKVVPGETLTAIAKRYGVPLNEILDRNGLDQDSILQPGQLIFIPRLD